ncbi:hypothetical protein GOBAR_AA28674 [Gossypium barbadense]|uniref:Uncharacterized protein n=1 Tax=Gossypium barbadense TaxID=3634 RepID=A0A2P5WLU5_GOSBA|nr:hypothetical protein GOBAR_AA28674 [Gossypium barbadense]
MDRSWMKLSRIFHGECTSSGTSSTINPTYPDTDYHQYVRQDDMEGKMRRRRVRDLSIVQNTPNSKERNSEQQTVVGSSNVPETLDEPEEFQIESGGTRRVRGRTLLRDLYDLDPVERVKVSRNTHGQPVGSEARLLAGYLGILARNANMLPINYESWHHIPDSNKNQALANIKERFALEVSNDYIKKALERHKPRGKTEKCSAKNAEVSMGRCG